MCQSRHHAGARRHRYTTEGVGETPRLTDALDSFSLILVVRSKIRHGLHRYFFFSLSALAFALASFAAACALALSSFALAIAAALSALAFAFASCCTAG